MEQALFPIELTKTKNSAAKSKRCPYCGEIKAIRYFSKDATKPDGYQAHCKRCQALIQKRSRERLKMGGYVEVQYKQCSQTGLILPISEFAKDASKKDGHRSCCKAADRDARLHRNRAKLLKKPQSQLDIKKAY